MSCNAKPSLLQVNGMVNQNLSSLLDFYLTLRLWITMPIVGMNSKFSILQHLVTIVVFRMTLRHNQVVGRILHYLLPLWLLSCSLLEKGPSHLHLDARPLSLLPAENLPRLAKQLSNLPFPNVFCFHFRIFLVPICQLKHTPNMDAENPGTNPANTICYAAK